MAYFQAASLSLEGMGVFLANGYEVVSAAASTGSATTSAHSAAIAQQLTLADVPALTYVPAFTPAATAVRAEPPVKETAGSVAVDALTILLGMGTGFFVGMLVSIGIQMFMRFIMRRHVFLRQASHPVVRPMSVSFAVVGAWVGYSVALPMATSGGDVGWNMWVDHAFLIATIAALTWLISSVATGVQDLILNRVKASGQSRYWKVQTQVRVLNRVVGVSIWILGAAAILMTFPLARAFGTSVFASAGVISVVAGLAAQSTLGNLFAGLQLAFSDSIRMGDIVIWNDDQYAKVEDITLSYVVLKVWDGRRLIVPSKELTTKTFENWTRRAPEMLGYVDLLLDWSVPIPALRAELDRILKETTLWDGNTGIIQVRAAESTSIQVSALVSAATPSNLIDLKFFVRERLVRWIQANAPDAVPHGRSFVNPPDPLLEEIPAADALLPAGRPDAPNSGRPDVVRPSGGKGESRPTFRSAGPQATPSGPHAKRRHDGVGPTGTRMFPAVPPVVRVPLADREPSPETAPSPLTETGYEASIFTGSAGAEKRAKDFAGPGEDAMREREEAARKKEGTQGSAEGVDGEEPPGGGEGPATEIRAGANGEAGAKA